MTEREEAIRRARHRLACAEAGLRYAEAALQAWRRELQQAMEELARHEAAGGGKPPAANS